MEFYDYREFSLQYDRALAVERANKAMAPIKPAPIVSVTHMVRVALTERSHEMGDLGRLEGWHVRVSRPAGLFLFNRDWT